MSVPIWPTESCDRPSSVNSSVSVKRYKLLDLAPELATRLTSSRLIVDFRNLLAHEYHSIDDEMVWAIAGVDVPVLADEVDVLPREQAKT